MKQLLMTTAVSTLLLLTAPATAEMAPTAGPFDPRVTYVDYNRDDVVTLQGAYLASTLIQLSDDESILAITSGDAIGWEIQPIGGNIVGIKPREKPMPATMQVVTTRTDLAGVSRKRIYNFMLTAKPDFVSRGMTDIQFTLTFRYPEDEAAKKAREFELASLDDDLKAVTADNAERRNLAYMVAGASSLEPAEVFDDGHFTYVKYPGNRPIPAAYEVDEDGAEALVNYHIEGEWLVIHQTGTRFTLRKGVAVLCLVNRQFDPVGTTQPNGVDNPLVQRGIKPTPDELKKSGSQP